MGTNGYVYSADLLNLAQEQLFLRMGIYDKSTPDLTPEQLTILQNFDSYIRENMKRIFLPENNVDLQLPLDYFDEFVFHLTDSTDPDAFILSQNLFPDKKKHICVSKGLLTLAPNEDALMGVVGHEVAHSIQKHLGATGNEKTEEAGADLMAMAHMKNAGYHPKYLKTVLEKLMQTRSRQPSYYERVMDKHPSDGLRKATLDMFLIQNASEYDAVKGDKPLNQSILDAVLALPQTDHRLTDIIMADAFKGAAFPEKMALINAFLRENQILLYGTADLDVKQIQSLRGKDVFWRYILATAGNPTIALPFDVTPSQTGRNIPQVFINERYLHELKTVLYQSQNEAVPAAVTQIFSDLRESNGGVLPALNETFLANSVHDDLSVQLLFLNAIQLTDEQAYNVVAPVEFQGVREKIARLYHANETEAALIVQQLRTVLKQGQCLTAFSPPDKKDKIVRDFVVPKMPALVVGEKHPLARWIEQARDYYRQTGRMDSLAHEVLCLTGVCDMDIGSRVTNEPAPMNMLGEEIVCAKNPKHLGYHFTAEEIEKYQPPYRLGQICGQRYQYNPETFEIQKIQNYSLDEYNRDLYANASLVPNSQTHYEVKKLLQDLETAPVDESMIDDIIRFTQYEYYYLKPEHPYAPKSLKYDVRLGGDKLEPSAEVTAEIARTNPELITPGEKIFGFVTAASAREAAIKAFIRLGRAAKTNPSLAANLIDTPAFWHLKWIDKHADTRDTFNKKYRDAYFQMLSAEPFVAHARKLIGFLREDDVDYFRQNFPDFLPRVYGYKKPQTSADLDLTITQSDEIKAYVAELKDAGTIYEDRFFAALQRAEVKDAFGAGKTDIPAGPLVFAVRQERFSAQQKKNFIANVANRDNWPQDMAKAMAIMRDGLLYFEGDKGFGQLPIYAQSLMDDYYEQIVAKSCGPEMRDLLKLFWTPGLTSSVPNDIRDKFFACMPENPGIWKGDISEQIKTYQWLGEIRAFSTDSPVKKDILTHLLDEVEKLPAADRERLVFSLLGKRAPIDFMVLQRRACDMWVDAVVELMGQPDDMSDVYLQKMQPIIDKLNNDNQGWHTDKLTFHFHFDDEYTALSAEIRNRLGYVLQEKLVSQEKLSALLDFKWDLSGVLTDDKKKENIGGWIEAVYFNAERNPEFSNHLLTFLTSPPGDKSVQAFYKNIKNTHFSFDSDGMLHFMVEKSDPKVWLNLHDQFWDKPFEVRAAIVKNLSEIAYKDHEKIVEGLLDRIFERTESAHVDAFKSALRNYAEAVPADERHDTYFLLSGCLAAAKPAVDTDGSGLSQGKLIRSFLESQGPAGIKVGQFMALQGGVPVDIQSELMDLTNHASAPSRAAVFDLLRSYHPEVLAEVRQQGLGRLLGAASHYMTFDLGVQEVTEVLSVSKYQSGLEAERVYKRMLGAIEKTMIQQPENNGLLNIVRDAVMQARRMNDTELNGNVGYIQMRLSKKLYDNVEMDIDGFHIDFKTMDWTRKPAPYRSYVTDGGVHWAQNYKIMEKAPGESYKNLGGGPEKTALAKANVLLNLRAMLAGGVFDDDRHQGQLNVVISPGNRMHVYLFDTGSTSLKPPTRQEREELGEVLYTVFNGLKEQTGESVADLLHEGVAKIRERHGCETPAYLAKVERGMANLTHFTDDVPAKEMRLLLLRLINTPGAVHADILRGMARQASFAEKRLFTSIASNLSIDETVQKSATTADLISALDGLFHLPEITNAQNKVAAFDGMMTLFTELSKTLALDSVDVQKMSETIDKIVVHLPVESKRILGRHLVRTVETLIQISQTKTDALKIQKTIVNYLREKGLSKELRAAISRRLPTKGQRFIFNRLMFPFGKLFLGHERVNDWVTHPIQKGVDALLAHKESFLVQMANLRVIIGDDVVDKSALPQLDTAHVNQTGVAGNRTLLINKNLYQQK